MAEKFWQKEIECASRDELCELQSRRLVSTVARVYEKVPLYRERMKESGVEPGDITGICDLYKLPFTSKQDLRDTYPYGMFAVPLDDVVRLHASSGTTGKQIVVGYTQNDLDTWENICARQLCAIGATHTDKVHISYGYGLFTGGFGIHGGATKLGATVIPVSSGNTARQITIMKDFGSNILCCTPSYAMYIAESLESAGVSPEELSLRAGIFGAEPWTEEMREQIERKLGIKAYDIYGLTEIMGPGVAYECSAQKGMHVNEDHFIIEILDPDTHKPVPDGEKGEIVFTCLTKEAFPLIRFRTKDIGVITHEKCECGRSFARMSKPMGRTDDMLIIRGVNVFPTQIEGVILEFVELEPHYLLTVDRINNTDRMSLDVEMRPEYYSDEINALMALRRRVAARLQSVLGLSVEVHLAEPRSIERSTGKAKHVIDKRNFKQ